MTNASAVDNGKYQLAYHGSPYRFSRFSLASIGSGEGAQAFGWGLYFASRREIAEWYRDTLSTSKSLGVPQSRLLTDPQHPVERKAVSEALSDFRRTLRVYSLDKPVKNIFFRNFFDIYNFRQHIDALDQAHYESNRDDIDSKISDMGAQIRVARPDLSDAEIDKKLQDHGMLDLRRPYATAYDSAMKCIRKYIQDEYLYQVDIPEDEELLIWDLPYKDQSEKVKRALQCVTDRLEAIVNDRNLVRSGLKAKLPHVLKNSSPVLVDDLTGKEIYEKLFGKNITWREASMKFNELGIPGLRYLDGTSRHAKQGSYNYVIWDTSRISIEAVNDQLVQAAQYSLMTDMAGKQEVYGVDLSARLRKLGLDKVIALKFVNDLVARAGGDSHSANARYADRLLEISLKCGNQLHAFNHEIIHALRDLGVIAKSEWSLLVKAARNDNVLWSRISEQYKVLGLGEQAMEEEAVAEMYADWVQGRSTGATSFVRSVFERITGFFKAVFETCASKNPKSVQDIFMAIENGGMAKRACSVVSPSIAGPGLPGMAY